MRRRPGLESKVDSIRLFLNLTWLHIGKLCRRLPLLAGLAVFCVLLPAAAGRGAESLMTRGADFSGFTLAVTAPDGDGVPSLLEEQLGRMSDVRRYCSVRAMSPAEARRALEKGRISAVVELPSGFIDRVQWGENPDVRVLVDGRKPLTSLLLLGLGESASDLLSAVQAGIYAVLDICGEDMPAGPDRDQVVADINLRYITWTLNRDGMFREEQILPTGELPIALHYLLSFSFFLFLAAAPAFSQSYRKSSLVWQRRLRCAGHGPMPGFLSSLAACALMSAAALFLILKLALPVSAGAALAAAVPCGVFFAAFTAVCSLLTSGAAGCGVLSFAAGGLSLFFSGGIVPPALMPESLLRLGALSPVARMRELAAAGLGFGDGAAGPSAALLFSAAVLCIPAALLYVRRAGSREAEP